MAGGGRRHEALGRDATLGHDPVGEVLQAARQAHRQPGPGDHGPGQCHRTRTSKAALDPFEPIGTRLNLLGGSVQDATEHRLVVWPGVAHASRSSSVLRVAIALAV
jgi:hypothetical protein